MPDSDYCFYSVSHPDWEEPIQGAVGENQESSSVRIGEGDVTFRYDIKKGVVKVYRKCITNPEKNSSLGTVWPDEDKDLHSDGATIHVDFKQPKKGWFNW